MNYDKELGLAKKLAYGAGKIIVANFSFVMEKDWKSDNTPVTKTDIAVNRLVIEKIYEHFPEHGVVGEEESKHSISKFTWVCDPVDGTVPFSHGLPISTFSLALCVNGKPVLGVVYDPFMDRLFWAINGQGAFCNGKQISVFSGGLKNAVIDLEGFPSSSKPVIEPNIGLAKILNDAGAHTTTLWSVILPSVLVAAGQFSATIFNVAKPEDGAAIKVIIEEAGGKVTDLHGEEQLYDKPIKGFIASNGLIHNELIEIIKEAVSKNENIRN